jgi:hypothetical protein
MFTHIQIYKLFAICKLRIKKIKMILHIIHLHERTDRLILLKKELEKQKIYDFQVWKGIEDKERPCRGISKAHKNIVSYAMENRLPSVLIGEDDLKFTASGAFNFFLHNIPPDFDIYLAGIIYGKLKKDNSVDDFSGTTLYPLNERFYKTFLSLEENKDVDRALANKGKFIVCNPMTVIQHNGYSDNSKRFLNFEPYIRKRDLFGIDKTEGRVNSAVSPGVILHSP